MNLDRRRSAARLASHILLPSLFVAFGATAHAAQRSPAKLGKVLVLVKRSKQLPVVLKTEMQLLEGKGGRASAAEVVVCGPAVKSLLRTASAAALLARAHAKGVRVVACGLSLARAKLERAKLSPAVKVVPNGLIETFRRQAQGWRSIAL